MESINVRLARREDCEAIWKLRSELSAHNAEHSDELKTCTTVTVEDLQRDGFDVDPPYFKCLVAEVIHDESNDSQIVGYGLYYYSYACHGGRKLHLEDLCVSKNCRGKGVGNAIFKGLGKICKEENLDKMQLECYKWNSTAQNFYKKLGGIQATNSLTFIFEGDVMKTMAI